VGTQLDLSDKLTDSDSIQQEPMNESNIKKAIELLENTCAVEEANKQLMSGEVSYLLIIIQEELNSFR